jgi:hypothetical protein
MAVNFKQYDFPCNIRNMVISPRNISGLSGVYSVLSLKTTPLRKILHANGGASVATSRTSLTIPNSPSPITPSSRKRL